MTGSSIAVSPFAINGGILKLGGAGGNTYEQAVSSLSVTPSVASSSLKAIAPGAVYPFVSAPTWAMALQFAQDIKTATSLLNYLIANAGTTVAFTFTAAPGTTGATTISGNVLIVPPAIGGAMDKNLDTTVTMPLSGNPVFGVAP